MSNTLESTYVLAFDTANETIAIGLGRLRGDDRAVEAVAHVEISAHRSSNTQLLPKIDEMLSRAGVSRTELACICVGRGPGSFTGVRIAIATAKGIAQAAELPLVGISSLDAVAWNCWDNGVRGQLLVVGDAMRHEVYPAEYVIDEAGAVRLTGERVVGADKFAEEFACEGAVESCSAPSSSAPSSSAPFCSTPSSSAPFCSAPSPDHSNFNSLVTGDALGKYADLFAPLGAQLPKELWTPTGKGLLLAFQAQWRLGEIDPFDAARHNPALVLPVYTRLSDAEENERVRIAKEDPTLAGNRGSKHITMNDMAHLNSSADSQGIAYKPLDRAHAKDIATLETKLMGSDAWSATQVADELGRADRVWWAAYAGTPNLPLSASAPLIAYAGALVVDGDMQVLKVGVAPEHQHKGIASTLLSRVAEDARNLGARTSSLEVRAGNIKAISFYEHLGYESCGVRPRYYSDGEDALIMKGSLPILQGDLHNDARQETERDYAEPETRSTPFDPSSDAPEPAPAKPLILAIETSCDETAAAVVDGEGNLRSDVIASQIDFHERFGGVVPEIASRKHTEAICGVCEEALARADISWADLQAIGVTQMPGLVGALVVGVAFAKGAAWALDIPAIGVNHLEGHLYANKLGDESFKPPAVVSLVSGGNTLLVYMRDWGKYEVLGETIDDAVGEAFDKVAKALGLPYPGGPHISRLAAEGNAEAIDFPRALLHSGDMRFSLSGLKTAVVNYVNQQPARELNLPDICASFQAAVIDVQIAKTKLALTQTEAPTFCLGGGVAANPALRHAYEKLCESLGVHLILPPQKSCGDNAGMIALVALDRFRAKKFLSLDADAYARADISAEY